LAAFSNRSKTALKAALSTSLSPCASLEGGVDPTLVLVGFHEMG
jgi:hypothetical protein